MSQKSGQAKAPAEKVVKDIRRATRKHYSAEEKIRIVLEGLRGEDSIAALCRREGLGSNIYYRWSKDFLEAGKKRLAGDVVREATSDGGEGAPPRLSQLRILVLELLQPPHLKRGEAFVLLLPAEIGRLSIQMR